MANRRNLLFLFFAFVVLVIAAYLFLGLWKLGVGEWAFLASTICVIIGILVLLYVLAQVENKGKKLASRRISFLAFAPLTLMLAGLLFFGLSKLGVGEWPLLISLLFCALGTLTPAVWFITQPNLLIDSDWGTLSPMRRALVYLWTVTCLIVGIVIFVALFHQIF